MAVLMPVARRAAMIVIMGVVFVFVIVLFDFDVA
jgi:hypothetical protein